MPQTGPSVSAAQASSIEQSGGMGPVMPAGAGTIKPRRYPGEPLSQARSRETAPRSRTISMP
jgi:hypothetical protein